jgi:hypothetical protein
MSCISALRTETVERPHQPALGRANVSFTRQSVCIFGRDGLLSFWQFSCNRMAQPLLLRPWVRSVESHEVLGVRSRSNGTRSNQSCLNHQV